MCTFGSSKTQNMKIIFSTLFLGLSLISYAQKKTIPKQAGNKTIVNQTKTASNKFDLAKINDSIPALIPYKIEGKSGFINQKGQIIIPPIYSNVGFFTEDCNLLNSANPKVKKFGSKNYASVRINNEDYRLDQSGKRVYHFKNEDLGKCSLEFKTQLFHAYIMNKNYGIIEDAKFENPHDYRQFTIYPQYDYLHIMEGDDLKNPMIVAVRNNKFGVINVKGQVIVPFEYEDIKRNYSWKIGRLFEVSKDGNNYYYIDENNNAY